MSRPFFWMAVALAAAPAFAWLIYRLARGLGFLDPPVDRQHELRRTIVVAVYSFLLFLPVLFYGFEKSWPRAWVIFGVVDGLALAFFAASGIWSAIQLWNLRHGGPAAPTSASSPDDPGHAGLAAAAPHGDASKGPETIFDPTVRS